LPTSRIETQKINLKNALGSSFQKNSSFFDQQPLQTNLKIRFFRKDENEMEKTIPHTM